MSLFPGVAPSFYLQASSRIQDEPIRGTEVRRILRGRRTDPDGRRTRVGDVQHHVSRRHHEDELAAFKVKMGIPTAPTRADLEAAKEAGTQQSDAPPN